MTCLLKTEENRKLVQEYADIVGSEKAAYYLLTSNNGYTLDCDPEGMPSRLYQALLYKNKGDVNKTIIEKAIAYTPSFISRYGDWLNKGWSEPRASSLIPEINSMSNSLNSILQNAADVDNLYEKLASADIYDKPYCINSIIKSERSAFINQYIEDILSNDPDLSDQDLYLHRLNAKMIYDKVTIIKLVGQTQKKLAKIFNLIEKTDKYGNVYYESKDTSSDSALRVSFVNSISYSGYTDEKGGVHKGMFVEKGVRNATMNLIYVSMEKGDISTIVHEFGHYYIRQFWYSAEVQEALAQYDPQFGNRSVMSLESHVSALEEKLVRELTGRVLKDVNQTKVRAFWKKFKNIIYNTLIKPFSEEDYKDVMDIIVSNFYLQKDLTDAFAEEIYYEKVADVMFQGAVLDSDIDSVYKIKDVINKRITAIKKQQVQDDELLYKLQRRKELMDGRIFTDPADIVLTITETLDDCQAEIVDTIRLLGSIKINGVEKIDAKEFLRLKTDVIGYYSTILKGSDFTNLFEKTNISELQKGSPLYKAFEQSKTILDQLQTQYDIILEQYIDYSIDNYVDLLIDMVPDIQEGENKKTLKEQYKYNAKAWARNQIKHGDLMFGEQWFGAAVNSRSPLIRQIDYMVRESNGMIQTEVLKRGHKLVDLWLQAESFTDKLNLKNPFERFIELDKNGHSTGNFLQRVNVGQAYQDKDQFIKSLIKKYNLERDEDGEIVFPNDDVYLSFNDDLDMWLGEIINGRRRFHRRYTPEYYILKRHTLSRETIQMQQSIQKQIDRLVEKSIDIKTGVRLESNLNPEEQEALKKLRQEKRDLANPYIIIKDDSGKIVRLIKKEGQALAAAEEIMEFNRLVNSKIEYIPDNSKYQSDLEKVESEYGKDSYEYKKFVYDNTERRVTQDGWDLMLFGTKRPAKWSPRPGHSVIQSAEVQKLKSRRNAIIKSVTPGKGYSIPKLELLNDEAWAELKSIDEQLGKLQIIKNNGKFDEVAKMSDVPINVTYQDGTQSSMSYFQYLYQQAISSNTVSQFENKYRYQVVNDDGSIAYIGPLSVFKYMDVKTDYIEDTPVGRYTTATGDYIDNYYDEDEGASMQPDEVIYENKNYDILNPDSDKYNKQAADFFNELISIMKDACNLIPGLSSKHYLVMPQIRDDNKWRQMMRSPGSLARAIGGEFIVTEDDTEYNENFATRPDGSIVQSVPLRWIKRLDDPKMISTDIIATVLQFYEMALNYNAKNEIAPYAELMLSQISGGFGNKTNTEQSQRLEKYIQMYIYDRQRKGFGNGRMSAGEQVLSRLSSGLQNKAHAKLMSHNWRTVAKNALDSFWNTFGEIIGGKYINWKDAMVSWKEQGKELITLKFLTNLGNPNTKSPIAAAMQFNGVDSISESFKGQRVSRARRVITKHNKMGEYTLVDYIFKGFMTRAVYNHHRLVLNPNTNALEFMNQQQAEAAYETAGFSSKEGLKQWSKAETTLWDAYYITKDGNWELKEQYEDVVRPYNSFLGRRSRKLETRIRTIISERSANTNGVLDKMDRGSLSQNYIGALFLQMRGWQVTQTWDKYKTGTDFSNYMKVRDFVEQGGIKNKSQDYSDVVNYGDSDNYAGIANVSTGYVERGVFLQMLKGIIKIINIGKRAAHISQNTSRLTSDEKYALRRVVFATAALGLSSLLTFLSGRWWEYDQDSIIANFLYTVCVSQLSERSGYLPIIDMFTNLDILKAPMVAKAWLDDLSSVFEFSYFSLYDRPFGDYNSSAPVKRGAYKGESMFSQDDRTEYEKSFLKASSVLAPEWSPNNVVKNMSKQGNISSQNWYKSIFPTNAITYNAKIGDRESTRYSFVDWLVDNYENYE